MLNFLKNIINPFKLIVVTSMVCSIALTGCNTTSNIISKTGVSENELTKIKMDLSQFIGCYTINNDEPAQIKISKQDYEWIMQMKEPPASNQVWDEAEPLEVINKSETSKFFSIDANYIEAIIARPDRMLVLAHIEPAYANIDSYLDSEYIAYIDKGPSMIYKVQCDEVKMLF